MSSVIRGKIPYEKKIPVDYGILAIKAAFLIEDTNGEYIAWKTHDASQKHGGIKNKTIVAVDNEKVEINFTDVFNIKRLYKSLSSAESILNTIAKRNEDIEAENKIIDIINEKRALLRWNDSVIYKNKRYGIEDVYNYIHREYDCWGKIHREPVIIKGDTGKKNAVFYRCGKCYVVVRTSYSIFIYNDLYENNEPAISTISYV